MCNVAGYTGNRQAAPILLEMLRRQQDFDGGMSTGIATIHEGKLYYRKVIGNVDKLIAETDALELPGTVGIAHTRPGGTPGMTQFAHPSVNMEETLALITNGATQKNCGYEQRWDEAAQLLEKKGYKFKSESKKVFGQAPVLSNNAHVHPPEVRAFLVDMYMKQGMSITEALARTCEDIYADNVSVVLHQDVPGKFFACRTNRPLSVLMTGQETYAATTRFAFPENLQGKYFMIPTMNVCSFSAEGVTITQDRVNVEEISDMTPHAYIEGYRFVEDLLRGKKDAPLSFDDIEAATFAHRDHIFDGNHTFAQHSRLVYDIMWQLKQEGRLKIQSRLLDRSHHPVMEMERQLRENPTSDGVDTVLRAFMWLED